MTSKTNKIIIAGLSLTVASIFICSAQKADDIVIKTQKLNASIVKARSRMRASMRLRFGLPQHGVDRSNCRNILSDVNGAEKISCEGAYWMSWNEDLKFPNWVAWNVPTRSVSSTDVGPVMESPLRWVDYFTGRMPGDKPLVDNDLWSAVMEETSAWSDESPSGATVVVCGPMLKSLDNPVPSAIFVALCKRTGFRLGYKSVAFLLPCGKTARTPLYNYSLSVNILEKLSGYDFFPDLPPQVQEMVENMTTYELFCSYQEERDYQEGPELPDNDFQDVIYDLMDFR